MLETICTCHNWLIHVPTFRPMTSERLHFKIQLALAPTYITPEMLNGYSYGGSVDWWSLGILLYQMMSGRSPFHHDNDEILFQLIQHRQVVTPSTFSKESQDIIIDLLEKDTKKKHGCMDIYIYLYPNTMIKITKSSIPL